MNEKNIIKYDGIICRTLFHITELSASIIFMNNHPSDEYAESNNKSLFVTGLVKEVNQSILEHAFLPFGAITEIVLNPIKKTDSNQQFKQAVIKFAEREDAENAIDNMNQNEIMGHTISVKFAKIVKNRKLEPGEKAVAIWNEKFKEQYYTPE